MGVSPRTAAIEMAIGRNLGDGGKRLYDDGLITKNQAEQLSHLDKPRQEIAARAIASGEADFAGAMARTEAEVSPVKKSSTQVAKACRLLEKAVEDGEVADAAVLSKIKAALARLEKRI